MWHQRKQITLLTCDAVGVQLPISRLAPNQVRYHVISGYTAEVAGSERGVKETARPRHFLRAARVTGAHALVELTMRYEFKTYPYLEFCDTAISQPPL